LLESLTHYGPPYVASNTEGTAWATRTEPSRGPKTKTLAWKDSDEAALQALRSRVAAVHGVILSERDAVAAAIRTALTNPAALGPARPAA